MAPLNNSGIPPKRVLPSKEGNLFKELLSFYESRQLKKGLKTADQILKKCPEHGETTCMKGLVLTHMGKREEGIELVKKGIKLDITSHICWHVFGLIQKGEKNYEEALKSYTQALKFDKENLNILRDAAQLQTQLRIYDGLVETRYILLKMRPNLRQHWIAMAVAHHLNGNLVEARKTLDHYERTLKDVPPYDVEHSETLLYHVRILEELKEYSDALSLLDSSSRARAIVDRTAIMEIRARLLSKQESPEAEYAWRALVEHNSDCYDYYRGFLANHHINLDAVTDRDRAQALAILQDFASQLPRAAAPKRLALDIARDDEFKSLASTYLLSGLKKGVPSLFADIKALYRDSSKQQIIEDIVEAFREDLTPPPHTEGTTPHKEPTTYLWTLYFLSQHHSFLSRPARALEILATALEHTPTLPELYTCKARTLKRAGDLVGAAHALDEARLLDGQDRFLNTKSGKYRLRAGDVEGASEVFGLFTKKDAPTPGHDLEDMQSLLFLVEEGNTHYRNGKLGLAMKRYLAVEKIFSEIEDDQYDFHGYSIRRFTINIYINLLKWEDQLRSHPAYVTSALSAAKIYVAAYDDPAIASGGSSDSQLTGAEKKAKKKAKKAAQKVQEEPKKATPAASANEDKGLEPTPPTDDDPDGAKLLAATDPLERSAKLLAPLPGLVPKNVEVWLALFDVAIRRKKFLQAAKALNQAKALDADHPQLHVRLVEFNKIVSSRPSAPSTLIEPVLLATLSTLIPGEVTPERYNSQYLQTHSTYPWAILAVAQATRKLEAPREEVEAVVFSLLGEEVLLDIKSALSAVAFLTLIKSPRVDEFNTACDAKFELSTVFKTSVELGGLRKELATGVLEGGSFEVVS